MQPRLTIALPVYNGDRYLEQTVRSLLCQTYPDFLLIIGDNASTDSTGEIARGLSAQDRRIRYVRNERNLGLAGNYNALFRGAQGELFKWAPADDSYHPEYLTSCVAALDADPGAVLAYPSTQFVDENGQPLEIADPGWHLPSDDACDRLGYTIRADHWVNSIVGVIRSAALQRTHLLGGYPGSDYVLLGELSLLGKFIEVPEKLFYRRLHPAASSQMVGKLDRLVPWFAGREGGLNWPTWQRTLGHLATITASPLTLRQRMRLLADLARASLNRRVRLRRELVRVGCSWMQRPGRGRA